MFVKRIVAALTVVFLFAASMLSYADCWLYLTGSCAAASDSTDILCHEVSAPLAPSCHEPTGSGCQAEKACPSARVTTETQRCAQEPDHEPRCHRMLAPPLVADGPSRAITVSPDLHACATITFRTVTVAGAVSLTPETPPPRAIHESIATNVLRI